MRIEPDISTVSVVLLGSFNPAIFTPAWFGLEGLLPRTTVESAELGVAHPNVTQFDAEWLKLRVRPDKFVVETSQAPTIRVSDLVVRTFREKLPHTPIKALGMNREVHFRVQSLAERDRIGRKLAPTAPWGEWGSSLEPDGDHWGNDLSHHEAAPTGRSSFRRSDQRDSGAFRTPPALGSLCARQRPLHRW
ncbi:MAG: hypothetical protein OXH70_02180 [Acidobacteria bacterium]|nr:hypothetical protein [Acidobacteriota bacterium]